jgi:hypothetical protein
MNYFIYNFIDEFTKEIFKGVFSMIIELPLSGIFSSNKFLKLYDLFKSIFKVKQFARLLGLFAKQKIFCI